MVCIAFPNSFSMYLYIVGSIHTVRFAFKLIINLIYIFLFYFYILKEYCGQTVAPTNFMVLKYN
jgi:hypothetical protein